MNIQEATKVALEEGKFIARESFKGHAKIQPTNDIGGCILSTTDNSTQPRGGWQPSATDLAADDWLVVDGDYGNHTTFKFCGMELSLLNP